MSKFVLTFITILALAVSAGAGDLYKITVSSEAEAELIRSLDIEPVLMLNDGYLVIADGEDAEIIQSQLKTSKLAAADIEKDRLAIDKRKDDQNAAKYPVVYQQDGLRLFDVDWKEITGTKQSGQLMPIGEAGFEIVYYRPKTYNKNMSMAGVDLDSLIGLVSQDSVESYLYRLEAFHRRLTGTDSCYAARDWIAAKFASFGYDSIVIDPFIGSQLWDRVPVQSYNVIATKLGTRYPDRQIVVGGHFDAVPDCPGADDNGSGTTGVLEIARVLSDIETEMTIIFIAFDSEESWMWGSFAYADSVAAIGKDIIYMQNIDMIGHYTNTDYADLYYGPEMAYALLWRDLADSLVGITGDLSGYTASDHTPFMANGYDVTFVQEKIFSNNYHLPSDSTTYIDFEYMTRMIQASLATDYMVSFLLPPIDLVSVLDVGDGQSLQLTWTPGDPAQIDHYMVYYGIIEDTPIDSIIVPKDSSRYIIDGLTEGTEYYLHVIPFDADGRTAIAYDQLTGTPYSMPAPPFDVAALPLVGGIQLTWDGDNRELDFDHFQIIRDGVLLPDIIYTNSYNDTDPGLGGDLHDYWVVAVDTDDNTSDTTGIEAVVSRSATLQEGKILAINRSGSNSAAMVDETVTGELLREALVDFSYEYMSDTSSTNPIRANLLDLVDYEMIIVGSEAARQDDIEGAPGFGNLHEGIEYYMSIGGKVIIFGRWGDIATDDSTVDSINYYQSFGGSFYKDCFDIDRRVVPGTFLNISEGRLESDLIGAHSQVPGYPELVWDSTASVNHWPVMTNITGIPCVSFCDLYGDCEVIYTYNSRNDSSLTEGKPVAWRNSGGPSDYVFFEIPLSFMERSAAIDALRQAVGDMGIISDIDDHTGNEPLPRDYALAQNYPNPFNPSTTIDFYNPESRPTYINLSIFNILGQNVRTLFDESANPGWNSIEWDGRDNLGNNVASGIYFYRLKADNLSKTKKMILLR